MGQARQGLLLVALGVAGAVVALVMRSDGLSDHEADEMAQRYTDAYTGRSTPPEGFDSAPYFLGLGACALLVVCGVILYAVSRDA